MKTNVKFWQEKLPDGSIGDSWIRALSLLSFILLCLYLYFSITWYKEVFKLYTSLLTSKNISEQTYITLTMQLKQVDELVFWVLVILTAVPKVIQKFAETYIGNKINTSTTSTSVSKEIIKTN